MFNPDLFAQIQISHWDESITSEVMKASEALELYYAYLNHRSAEIVAVWLYQAGEEYIPDPFSEDFSVISKFEHAQRIPVAQLAAPASSASFPDVPF